MASLKKIKKFAKSGKAQKPLDATRSQSYVDAKRVQSTNNALPSNTVRDLQKAMEKFNERHLKFDGCKLAQPITDAVLDQVELYISNSKKGEDLNFFFFDNYPIAVVYFLRNYLQDEENPLFTEIQIERAFTVIKELDPLERVGGFKSILQTNRNKSFIKDFLLFLHGIVNRSSDMELCLQCLIQLFCGCIFKVVNITKKILQKQKAAASFVIFRAPFLFDDDKQDSPTHNLGVCSMQISCRKLGTDGMLYLLEQELGRIEDEMAEIDYQEIEKSFIEIENNIESLNTGTEALGKEKVKFDEAFGVRIKEVELLVNQCEPFFPVHTKDR